MVQHRRTFLQHLYELPHVYNFLEEVIFSIQRRPACPTTEQKRKSLRKQKKKRGPLEKYFQNCNSAKRTKPNVNLENECMARSIRQMLDAQQKPFAHAFSQSARGRSWHRKIYGQTVLEKNLCKKKAVSRRWKFFRRLIKKKTITVNSDRECMSSKTRRLQLGTRAV